ncbi:hypothetical protein HZS_1336 [Henneguya salminicola]|nr:hypothetical protein HZS_1336 [Henneguya salminicola]
MLPHIYFLVFLYKIIQIYSDNDAINKFLEAISIPTSKNKLGYRIGEEFVIKSKTKLYLDVCVIVNVDAVYIKE